MNGMDELAAVSAAVRSWAASLDYSSWDSGLFSARTADAAGDVFFPVEEDVAKCGVIRAHVAGADVRSKMDEVFR